MRQCYFSPNQPVIIIYMETTIEKSKIISYGDMQFALLYSQQQIQDVVKKMAGIINKHYVELLTQEENPHVVVLCILKGAFMFFSDLVKHFEFRTQAEFLRLSSYHGGLETSHQVKFDSNLNLETLRGKHILVIQDILDTGTTLAVLNDRLLGIQPKSVEIAVLVSRPDKKHQIDAKFVGLHCNDFIIGYGLDLDEYFRCLPEIYQKCN